MSVMSIWTDIFYFLFPRPCCMCGNRLTPQESSICHACLMHLPYTDYHTVEHSVLEKQFWELFPIERAVSMFHHDGDKTRHIIYNIKYYGHPEVAIHLASIYAQTLKECHFFDDIDCIIPLPLHWRRQMNRGYNQSHYIARGLHEVTKLPVLKRVVKRVKNNPSQTHLDAQQRMENVKGIFRLVHSEMIQGKHLLLIDDVTTTGATLASCAQELAKVPNVKISILTLAVASRTAIPAIEGDNIDVSIFGVPLME